MIILGINAHHADSSAAIFIDGKLIAAVEEERFTRIKHWAGFPEQSIEFCLNKANIKLSDVNHIAIGRDTSAKRFNKLLFFLQDPFNVLKHYLKAKSLNSNSVNSLEKQIKNAFQKNKQNYQFKLQYVEHHLCHLASAFYASGFDKAAIASLDGSGDFSTAMFGMGSDTSMRIFSSVNYPNSLGIFYSAMTQYLGFMNYGDEYKVMGLAAYGEPIYADKVFNVISPVKNGKFKLNMTFLNSPHKGYVSYSNDHIPLIPVLYNNNMENHFGKARKPGELVTQFHKDMAASIQYVTEQIIFHVLNELYTISGCTNLCLAGGVAQNSVANGKILKNTNFKNLYVPSAGHDAGISFGAALYIQHSLLQTPRQPAITTAAVGPSFSNEEIISLLIKNDLKFTYLENDILFDKVTDILIEGGVVGWFYGGAEFGPRALGGRSILMDPRRTDAKHILNKKIKKRESFRPFAPSILKEYVNDYFEQNDNVPFMEKVFKFKKTMQKIVPAVVHIDGTGRLQTVDSSISPKYYSLINTFRKKTGVPILLNTSFNENEPIVNHPQNAIDCFLRTEMDILVLENYYIERIKY